MLHRFVAIMLGASAMVLAVGCGPTFGPQAKNGVTFYCPGAGNIDFGDQGVRDGLQRAGYRGQVASVLWTISLNPLIDQVLRINAHTGAERLARYIEDYTDKYPGGEVNVIGLSAGTGVAIWALEDLKPGYEVNNVVLLGSSLSHDYDVGKALSHIKGKIYVYYSSNDAVLTVLMQPVGTIDGKSFTDGAGAVGLHSPTGGDRIVNIPWRSEFSQYGYNGGHTDSTSPAFVRARIAEHIISDVPAEQPRAEHATALAKLPADAHPN